MQLHYNGGTTLIHTFLFIENGKCSQPLSIVAQDFHLQIQKNRFICNFTMIANVIVMVQRSYY